MNGQWPDHIWHGSQTDRLQPKPEQPNEHPWLPAERLRLGQCPTAFQFLTNFLPTQSYPEKAKYYAPYSDHGGYPASTQLLLRLACLQLLLVSSLQSEHTWSLPPPPPPASYYGASPLSCLPLSLCQVRVMVAVSLALNK